MPMAMGCMMLSKLGLLLRSVFVSGRHGYILQYGSGNLVIGRSLHIFSIILKSKRRKELRKQ